MTNESKTQPTENDVNLRKWYVAVVNNKSEIKSALKLNDLGYETFVASQSAVRIWRNGRKSKVERIVISSMVFVRCTEIERRQIVSLPFIYRFLPNRAAARDGLNSPAAVIPDEQMDNLRFMLGHSDSPVSFVERNFVRHERVRVLRGGLAGLEGIVTQVEPGHKTIVIEIDFLGGASVTIDTINLEAI